MTGEFAVAVHALVTFTSAAGRWTARRWPGTCAPPRARAKVMAKLRQAGLVEAKAGAEGGYRFSLDPAEVTLRRVADALSERPVAALWRSGDASMDCMVASGMALALDRVYDELNRACLETLSSITISDVEAFLASPGPCSLEAQGRLGGKTH